MSWAMFACKIERRILILNLLVLDERNTEGLTTNADENKSLKNGSNWKKITFFPLKYVQKITKLTIFTTNSRPKTKNSRIYLKTQAKKLNFRHFQNQWISSKCTKKACFSPILSRMHRKIF